MVESQISLQEQGSNTQTDEETQARNIRRPFIKLYKDFKLLNSFAIINDVAIQELLKDFDSMFFMHKECQIVKKNIEQMINETHLKRDKVLLFRASEDLVEVYSQLFTKGNRERALRELDVRKTISVQNAIILSYFSGSSTYALFMLVSFLVVMVDETDYEREILDDFYSFGSLFRQLFVLAYLTFASGVCIMVWKSYEINYIHIMQIKYKDRMNHY